MSFRVECSPGFCGPDCMTTPPNNPRLATCQANGTLTCTDNRFDPSPLVACNDCLYNLDITTGCSTCMDAKFDPTTNCESCVYSAFDPLNGCTSCLLGFYDLQTNCTQCLLNRDPSTDCTQCLPGWDITSDCAVCSSGRNISTRCTTCMSGFTGSNCEPGEWLAFLVIHVHVYARVYCDLINCVDSL